VLEPMDKKKMLKAWDGFKFALFKLKFKIFVRDGHSHLMAFSYAITETDDNAVPQDFENPVFKKWLEDFYSRRRIRGKLNFRHRKRKRDALDNK